MGAPLVIFLRLLSTYNQIQANTGDIINLPSRGHLFLTYKRYATLPRSLCLITKNSLYLSTPTPTRCGGQHLRAIGKEYFYFTMEVNYIDMNYILLIQLINTAVDSRLFRAGSPAIKIAEITHAVKNGGLCLCPWICQRQQLFTKQARMLNSYGRQT